MAMVVGAPMEYDAFCPFAEGTIAAAGHNFSNAMEDFIRLPERFLF